MCPKIKKKVSKKERRKISILFFFPSHLEGKARNLEPALSLS